MTTKVSQNKKKRKQEETTPYLLRLPDHIVAKILCRFPTKTLVQYQLVCKSWRYPHLSTDLFLRTPTCLLLQDSGKWTRKSLTLVDFKSNSIQEDALISKKEDVLMNFPQDGYLVYNNLFAEIAGSCNGFLFLFDNDSIPDRTRRYFYINNPLTGESLSFLAPAYSDIAAERYWLSGFGFSPISNAYKAVGFVPATDEPGKLEVKVLTIGSCIWRSIGNSMYFIDYRSGHGGIYLNGFLHWIGGSIEGSRIIYAFDVERECFQEFPL